VPFFGPPCIVFIFSPELGSVPGRDGQTVRQTVLRYILALRRTVKHKFPITCTPVANAKMPNENKFIILRITKIID